MNKPALTLFAVAIMFGIIFSNQVALLCEFCIAVFIRLAITVPGGEQAARDDIKGMVMGAMTGAANTLRKWDPTQK